LAAPAVSAHVTVHPEESSTDAWEKYSVRIPVEKDMNTTEVELKAPEGINIVSVMPDANWDYDLEQDEDRNISAITWTATDDLIGSNRFIVFYFVSANPSETGVFSWDACQTYEDDSVVEWDGEPDTEEPASVTKVVEGDGNARNDDESEESPESA